MLEFEKEFLLCISTSEAVGEPSGCTSFNRLIYFSYGVSALQIQ